MGSSRYPRNSKVPCRPRSSTRARQVIREGTLADVEEANLGESPAQDLGGLQQGPMVLRPAQVRDIHDDELVVADPEVRSRLVALATAAGDPDHVGAVDDDLRPGPGGRGAWTPEHLIRHRDRGRLQPVGQPVGEPRGARGARTTRCARCPRRPRAPAPGVAARDGRARRPSASARGRPRCAPAARDAAGERATGHRWRARREGTPSACPLASISATRWSFHGSR